MKDEGGKEVRDLRARTKDFARRATESCRVEPLRNEVDELIAIFVTMTKKVKGRS